MNRATLLLTFKPGDHVRYIGFKPENKDRTGVVRNIVKRREIVVVDWDDDRKRYDAFPTSLQHIAQ